jgi:hypothetical protein
LYDSYDVLQFHIVAIAPVRNNGSAVHIPSRRGSPPSGAPGMGLGLYIASEIAKARRRH